MERFFVYDLVDPRCGRTFYVGKGCGKRPDAHTKEALAGKRSRKCQRIRDVLQAGLTVKAVIVRRFENENEAYAYEIERIAEFGLENLTNVLAGGRGGMARAVRLAEQMPKAMILGIAKVLALAEARKRVCWGGMDVTAFAQESLRRLINQFGLEAVRARFASVGALLTVHNNGV